MYPSVSKLYAGSLFRVFRINDNDGIMRDDDWIAARYDDIDEDDCDVISVTGSLMMVAWVTLASIGIIAARHYKGLLPDTEVCGKQVWFQVPYLSISISKP